MRPVMANATPFHAAQDNLPESGSRYQSTIGTVLFVVDVALNPRPQPSRNDTTVKVVTHSTPQCP